MSNAGWQCVAGWVEQARRVVSPNHDKRTNDEIPSLVVVHAISLPPDQFGGPGVEQLFTNTLDANEHPYYAGIHELRVSAHFFIRRDGELIQFVSVQDRAWHAGVSSWWGRERCNDFSIGIELEGCDTLPFEPLQYQSLASLVHCLQTHYPIREVVGHSDVAPGRKTDPGPCFDWSLFQRLLQALSI
ncbi:1,6-anhydro-N-acetylmuramyl-L-alanine amidase AmpD [Uliginosibacterium gangwonense]|uniref:1,6-anhydro-N-acetylmuramyl-L-alanine amidase AmpD n=1 Tax=Uliginosibacterium gangwonense TaxID=392736 RepID=UPI000368D00D|nr:1,6-anhydro-N-acetylmuramyl-L-alanine amidase AmpD [Uliginosibacterium gangwonense]